MSADQPHIGRNVVRTRPARLQSSALLLATCLHLATQDMKIGSECCISPPPGQMDGCESRGRRRAGPASGGLTTCHWTVLQGDRNTRPCPAQMGRAGPTVQLQAPDDQKGETVAGNNWTFLRRRKRHDCAVFKELQWAARQRGALVVCWP